MHAGDMEWVMPELIWHLEDLRVGQCYPNYYVARLAEQVRQGRAVGGRRRRAVRRLPVALLPRRHRTAIAEGYFRGYYAFWQRLVPDEDKAQPLQRQRSGARSAIIRRSTSFAVSSTASPAGSTADEDYRQRLALFRAEDVPARPARRRGQAQHGPLAGDAGAVPRQRAGRLRAERSASSLKVPRLSAALRVDENMPGKRQLYEAERNDGKAVLREAMQRVLPPTAVRPQQAGVQRPRRELVPRREHRVPEPAATRPEGADLRVRRAGVRPAHPR